MRVYEKAAKPFSIAEREVRAGDEVRIEVPDEDRGTASITGVLVRTASWSAATRSRC